MPEIKSINRDLYDHADEEKHAFIAKEGLNEDLITEIINQKGEPEWMQSIRWKGFNLFKETPLPDWGPSLKALDLNAISYFMRPDANLNSKSWEDVPENIRRTFDRLGIPEAEKKVLAGVGAQYDSEVIYHKLKKEWEDVGVIFEDMDIAVKKYPDIVKSYFMKCIPPNDHKFIMLHSAVWSGGTFIYVPKGVKLKTPLQAYFRMNAKKGGQFEHTLIVADEGSELHYIEGCSAPQYTESSIHAGCVEVYVKKGARVRYSSVENWSKNTFNLNTKRAIVEEDGLMEWVNGNMGSGVTMLYPCSVLVGERAKTDMLGIAFAGEGQNQDTGSKVIHLAKNTTSTIIAKSISKDGGISSYRGFVKVAKGASGVSCSVDCDALLIDEKSISKTFPIMKIEENSVNIAHEARVGNIGEEQIFYLMSRGLSEENAKKMIVLGFIEPIVKALPLEYAVELNRLIEMEMEGSVG